MFSYTCKRSCSGKSFARAFSTHIQSFIIFYSFSRDFQRNLCICNRKTWQHVRCIHTYTYIRSSKMHIKQFYVTLFNKIIKMFLNVLRKNIVHNFAYMTDFQLTNRKWSTRFAINFSSFFFLLANFPHIHTIVVYFPQNETFWGFVLMKYFFLCFVVDEQRMTVYFLASSFRCFFGKYRLIRRLYICGSRY